MHPNFTDEKNFFQSFIDLINKIKHTKISQNFTQAWFDNTNLYANIPITQTISILT